MNSAYVSTSIDANRIIVTGSASLGYSEGGLNMLGDLVVEKNLLNDLTERRLIILCPGYREKDIYITLTESVNHKKYLQVFYRQKFSKEDPEKEKYLEFELIWDYRYKEHLVIEDGVLTLVLADPFCQEILNFSSVDNDGVPL